MSENNDKQLPVPSGKPDSSPRPRRLWPLWLLILLLAASTAALGLGLWQQWQEREQVSERLDTLETRTGDLQNEQVSLRDRREDRLNRLESKLDEHASRHETQTRQIEHNARALLGLGQRTRTDWLLAEAEYLMRLANQRLFFEHDQRGALAILESADEVLNQSDDAGVYPVRQALAREILALRAVEPVDQAGLWVRLDAAIERLRDIEEAALKGPSEPRRVPDADDLESDPDGDVWTRITRTLKDVVLIRRLDEPVEPLLSPDQSRQARLHLTLMLEEAGIAVLRRDQTLYDRTLRRAVDALERWYDTGHPEVRSVLQTLETLREQQVDPALPDISESLRLLKSRIEGRLAADEATEPEDADEEADE